MNNISVPLEKIINKRFRNKSESALSENSNEKKIMKKYSIFLLKKYLYVSMRKIWKSKFFFIIC